MVVGLVMEQIKLNKLFVSLIHNNNLTVNDLEQFFLQKENSLDEKIEVLDIPAHMESIANLFDGVREKYPELMPVAMEKFDFASIQDIKEEDIARIAAETLFNLNFYNIDGAAAARRCDPFRDCTWWYWVCMAGANSLWIGVCAATLGPL
ncbi:MAG: hypothetical protein R3B47_10795 [Bacteroidia bacterium]